LNVPAAQNNSDDEDIEIIGGVVLLIDDSPVAAKVATEVLKRLNFQVLVADSAEKGFDLLKKNTKDIQIVFLDVVMPKVDGVECLMWIKDNPEVSHIPVYMLSGLEDQTLVEVVIERGAEGMLMKPLSQEKMMDVLKEQKATLEARSAIMTSRTKRDDSQIKLQESNPEVTLPMSQRELSPRGRIGMKGVLAAVGKLAPAFKLCSSQFEEVLYPSSQHVTGNLLLAFIPTIYYADFYKSNGFLVELFEQYSSVRSDYNIEANLVCISSDLPWALAAGKKRFDLPFTLLSDPLLQVASKYVGTMDIGKYKAKDANYLSPGNVSDVHSHEAPVPGLVLINSKRIVVAKWTAFDALGSVDMKAAAPNVIDWMKSLDHTMNTPSASPFDRSVRGQGGSEDLSAKSAIRHTSCDASMTPPLSTRSRISNNADYGPEPPSSSRKSNFLAPASARTTLRSARDTPGLAETDKQKKNILLVDDSSVSSRVATKKLEEMGYSVTCAYNGLLAYEVLKKDLKKFFVIFLDICMPVCIRTNSDSLIHLC
jgi:CheY-like chemotaxis protein